MQHRLPPVIRQNGRDCSDVYDDRDSITDDRDRWTRDGADRVPAVSGLTPLAYAIRELGLD